MYERSSETDRYREIVRLAEKAPVRFECIPATASNQNAVKAFIHRAARSLSVTVWVRTVDETGRPLPPGQVMILHEVWKKNQGEDDEG